jgi:hypothetical protein
MTILFSPSLNTEFDDNVTPLDQIPLDALKFASIFSSESDADVTLEVTPVVEVQADIL